MAYITLQQVAARFPSARGETLSAGTVRNWVKQGVRLPDGRVIKLQTIRVGGQVLTTQELLEAFIREQQAPLDAVLDLASRGSFQGIPSPMC